MRAMIGLMALALVAGCGDKDDDDGDSSDSGLYGGDGADGADGEDGEDGADGSDGTGGTGSAYGDCHAEDGHATDLNAASISGDTLSATVAYSGGCEAHEFSLCWPDRAFAESEPVQVTLEILHEGPPDPCEAYPSEELSFDLTPLKEAWQDSYGATSGTITVHVATTHDRQTVTYSF